MGFCLGRHICFIRRQIKTKLMKKILWIIVPLFLRNPNFRSSNLRGGIHFISISRLSKMRKCQFWHFYAFGGSFHVFFTKNVISLGQARSQPRVLVVFFFFIRDDNFFCEFTYNQRLVQDCFHFETLLFYRTICKILHKIMETGSLEYKFLYPWAWISSELLNFGYFWRFNHQFVIFRLNVELRAKRVKKLTQSITITVQEKRDNSQLQFWNQSCKKGAAQLRITES